MKSDLHSAATGLLKKDQCAISEKKIPNTIKTKVDEGHPVFQSSIKAFLGTSGKGKRTNGVIAQ